MYLKSQGSLKRDWTFDKKGTPTYHSFPQNINQLPW